MSKGINIGVYKPIIAVRDAWSFDFGAALMRIYTCMVTIGSVSMLTLLGNSVLLSGSVSSCVALATFLISPRVSRRIDERGQSKVIPIATAIALAGLALMLCTATFGLPFWLNYIAGIAMGFVPNAAALARTRWTFLVKTRADEHDLHGVSIKTVFGYEGVIDDVSFMIGPAASVALSASLFPAAGLGFGGICYVVGAMMLLASKSTEPTPGWSDDEPATATTERRRSLFVESGQVRVLFMLMFFLGGLYGVMDTATVTFGQDLGVPVIASVALALQALISVVSGMAFGATHFKQSLLRQWLVVCALIGCSYVALALVRGLVSFFLVISIGALFYAPFLITLNTACERSVSGSRLTEGITWITSGLTFGLAVGPTLAGVFIDKFGSIAGFNVAAAFAAMIPITALLCIGIMRRTIGGSNPEN